MANGPTTKQWADAIIFATQFPYGQVPIKQFNNYLNMDTGKSNVPSARVGTSDGLRMKEDCEHDGTKWKVVNKNPEKPPVWKSEEEFFEWLGIEWIEPSKRNL